MESNDIAPTFKKPILIGKIGKLPKQVSATCSSTKKVSETNIDKTEIELVPDNDDKTIIANEQPKKSLHKAEEKSGNLEYKEPPWSGLPNKDYCFEILKEGLIIGNINLKDKSYWVFGRLPQCDISMAHPTISRYHAILQYRQEAPQRDKLQGFYLYDLGSTHGTFLNKLRLQPYRYVRVHVGHMIKLGCSSRNYILVGPNEDQEDESELTITEMKQQRQEERDRKEQLVKDAEIKAEQERVAREKKEIESGIDWGMGEDADDETDLTVNPYAQTNNEELYLDDPKKALRGFMEREGVEFEYDCSEQGLGQFLCKVTLPLDDERGRPIKAEVLHNGKKKEAVIQCALEACRILDRFGVLRQATHEGRKRKGKNWQENDYYDSDEDTFLDRTGTIERKRENRMKAKQPQAETYLGLLEKEKILSEEITHIENQLKYSKTTKQQESQTSADSLDSFMAELKQPQLEKGKVLQLKTDLMRMKQDHAKIIKLVNIARPADLPPLTPQYEKQSIPKGSKSKFPMFGKRLKVKVEKPKQVEEVYEDHDEDLPNVPEETVSFKKEPSKQREGSQKSNPEDRTDIYVEDQSSLDSNVDRTCIIINKNVKQLETSETDEAIAQINEETRRRKNQRRIAQRQEKLEAEKKRGYVEDSNKEDYNMWIPPDGQTGDGKTTLNDKFGY